MSRTKDHYEAMRELEAMRREIVYESREDYESGHLHDPRKEARCPET